MSESTIDRRALLKTAGVAAVGFAATPRPPRAGAST